MNWTKETWYVFSHYGDPEIRTKDGDKLVAALLPSKLQDARRIVACVNACAGIMTADLEHGGQGCLSNHDAWAGMKTQRDDLLAAMKAARLSLQRANDGYDEIITDTIWHTNHETLFDFMDAAIANAEQKP